MTDRRPFDDVRAMLNALPEPDPDALDAAHRRQAVLLKPPRALGRLEDLAVWYAGWRGDPCARPARPMIAVYAGTHGVSAQGVSPYPPEVTAQMVAAFGEGKGAINQIAGSIGAGLQVFDLALDAPTPDITIEDALSEKACVATMAFGMESLSGDPDLLAVGEMGIGNTTVAAALALALFGGDAEGWVGAGTGADSQMRARKAEVAARAVVRCGDPPIDPLEALRRVGGREFAAMAGAILAARMQRVPVVLDGYAATVAAAALEKARPGTLDHCVIGHASREPGHRRLAAALGKRPLLDMDMALGEASGAALAIPVIQAACAAHAGMATFEDAGVSGPA